MSRVLILYGTTDGHTRAIGHAIAEPLSRHGIDTDVVGPAPSTRRRANTTASSWPVRFTPAAIRLDEPLASRVS